MSNSWHDVAEAARIEQLCDELGFVDWELDFIKESNKIEGIRRLPTEEEIREYHRFMQLKQVSLADMEQFVKVYQPDARLRSRKGLDVVIISRGVVVSRPPKGCADIKWKLQKILLDANQYMEIQYKDRQSAFNLHVEYETLHPFTDGNGRSGRMLWWWMMERCSNGFLHQWYYQTLRHMQGEVLG